MDSDQIVNRRREANRLSAARSRQRKKDRLEKLRAEIAEVEQRLERMNQQYQLQCQLLEMASRLDSIIEQYARENGIPLDLLDTD